MSPTPEPIGRRRHDGAPRIAVAPDDVRGWLRVAVEAGGGVVVPLDGAEAWPLFRLLYRRAQRARLEQQLRQVREEDRRADRAMREDEMPEELKLAMRQAIERARIETRAQ